MIDQRTRGGPGEHVVPQEEPVPACFLRHDGKCNHALWLSVFGEGWQEYSEPHRAIMGCKGRPVGQSRRCAQSPEASNDDRDLDAQQDQRPEDHCEERGKDRSDGADVFEEMVARCHDDPNHDPDR
jgi:hypothetical protein